MLHYQDAITRILQGITPLPSETLSLTRAHGRRVATPLLAAYPLPPFDQSMVDGYALRSQDTRAAMPDRPVRLPIGQTLTAGAGLAPPLAPRQAIRIMTGAPVPAGANTVIKLEDSDVDGSTLLLRQPVARGLFIQQRGAEMQQRTVLARQGDPLTPQRLGVALATGLAQVEVWRRPRVALVAPGDELLPPGAPWQPGKKWCSNLYALEQRAHALGCDSMNLGIVPDTLVSLSTQLRHGLENDVLVILGASGRGDHDFAARAMAEIGAEVLFRGVAANPGRGVTVARAGKTLIVGLPGTPWAAFVGFEVFVWPIVRALGGQRPALPTRQTARLAAPVSIRPGVTSFIPARLQQQDTGWLAAPVEHMLALAQAEATGLGLIVVPPQRRRLAAGSSVRLQPITPW